MGSFEKLMFVATPFIAWLVGGGLKFLFNSLRSKGLAFNEIGYGSFPSNHMGIITSAVSFAYFKLDEFNVAVTIGVAIAFIVALDAMTLRRKVGELNKHINQINRDKPDFKPLRERMGHTPVEIFGGIIVGTTVGFICASLG